MKIGILALQGDFAEHSTTLEHLGVEIRQVRMPDHLESLDGLIIPGGESTTIGKLVEDYHFTDPIREFGTKRAMWRWRDLALKGCSPPATLAGANGYHR